MEGRRFDRTVRVAESARSRRGVLAAFAGSFATATGADEIGAARCRRGTKRCGRRCRDFQTDPRACGGCGNRCGAGEHCDAGRCCPDGQKSCGDRCAATCEGDGAARRPFPQNLAYPGAVHRITHRSAEQQADDVRAAWDRWTDRYLARQVVGGEVRYWVRHGTPGHAQGWDRETVSEGMGYGMILAAHMAGDDPAAREIFDGLWRFARAWPSKGDERLMDWKVRPEGSNQHDHSAFDGDADMAYALLLAEAQWGNDGAIDYRAAFDRLIAGIEAATIGPDSAYPLLGDWVNPDDQVGFTQWTTRTSDFMPGHFRAFRRATGHVVWDRVLAATQRVVGELQEGYAARTGLLPDFVQPVAGNPRAPRPADPGFLEGQHDGHFFYNAGRTPWRLGTDGLLHAGAASSRQARTMAAWAREASGGQPWNIRAGYALNGEPVGGSNYRSTFFVAPFGVAAMLDPEPDAEAFLEAVYDAVRDEPQDYFEDSVALLCLLAMTGNFWAPGA